MLTEVEITNICNEKICLLQELQNDTKDKSESELKLKYKNGLNLIHLIPPIINEPIILYRSRLVTDVKEDITLPSTFSYAPLALNAKNKPGRGRMNLSGQSFFYASSSPETNYKEIKKDIAAGDEVYLSKWEIPANSKFSVYNVILAENISESANKNTQICITDSKIVNGPIGNYLRALSNIILMKEDNEDKQYLASSLIGNDILVNINGKSYKNYDGTHTPIHYDAIAYPSTRIGNGTINHYNWAITPQFIDQYASLKSVIKGTLREDLQSINFSNIGFNQNGKIEWYEPYIYIDNVNIISISFETMDGKIFSFEDTIVKDRDGKIVSENGLRKYLNERKESLIEECIEKNLLAVNMPYGRDLNKDSVIEGKTIRPINPTGWKLEKEGNRHDIERINIEVTYKNVFKAQTIGFQQSNSTNKD